MGRVGCEEFQGGIDWETKKSIRRLRSSRVEKHAKNAQISN